MLVPAGCGALYFRRRQPVALAVATLLASQLGEYARVGRRNPWGTAGVHPGVTPGR
ncbi:hypothetical protein ABT034_17420 [Streptomyces sp. NPDC002773]|uniref:hypothetical protein n=1 Tax=Streptomyces sp. NPDC002773 TaxID=3154430 RepID=UPI00332D1666